MPALIFNQNPFIWLMKTWDSNLVRIVIVCIKKLWFLQNSSGAQKACCAWFCLGKGIKISIWVIQGSNQIFTRDHSPMSSQLALFKRFLLSQMCFHRQKLEFAFGIEKKLLTIRSFPILQSKHCWNSSSS